jgi:DNA polymerase/3'-5' exonuclease PolX
MLADITYSMELEGEPASRIWPYRKAAWAVEDLDQDLGLVYANMGLTGLKSVENIGDSIGRQIEELILSKPESKV